MISDEAIEKIAPQFRPFELANVLPFRDAMKLDYRLLTHNPSYDPWRHYAIELLYAIRDQFPDDWSLSWRYDAYLGDACVSALRYHEGYRAYQQALTKVSPAPPELLVAIASCEGIPGIPLSEKEALTILTEVARKKPYKSVVRMLIKGDYKKFLENPKELLYWKNIYNDLEETNDAEVLLETMKPEFLTTKIETALSKLSVPPRKNRSEELFKIAKRVFSSEKIPRSVRGIAVSWQGDAIVLWVYHTDELASATAFIMLTAYTRIAACYLKDYSQANQREVQVTPTEELPHHEYWIVTEDWSSHLTDEKYRGNTGL